MTATVSMDPRIRARREEVAAENGRRRSVRIGAAVSVLVLGASLVAATRTPLLDVDEIAVRGGVQTAAGEVRTVSGISAGDPLTDVDLSAARSAIATLPWVDEVTSRRGWDGTVVFDITERVAVAQAVSADGATVAVVDAEGRVLEVGDAPRDGLVPVVGVRGSFQPGGWLGASALDAVQVAASVPPSLTAAVSAVGLGEDGSIVLTLDGVGDVAFGRSLDLDSKFTALETMLGQVDMTCVELLDLQVPGVPVLSRRSDC